MDDLARATLDARVYASQLLCEVEQLRAQLAAIKRERRAPDGELLPERVLPWVLWAMFDADEIYHITSTLTLPSEWWGDLPISRSAAQTIRRAWGEAHSSRWGAMRQRLAADGLRARIRAEVAEQGLTGRDLTDAVGIRFDDAVEAAVCQHPWPHTRERWAK